MSEKSSYRIPIIWGFDLSLPPIGYLDISQLFYEPGDGKMHHAQEKMRKKVLKYIADETYSFVPAYKKVGDKKILKHIGLVPNFGERKLNENKC